MGKKYDGLIFDVDGTLWDSRFKVAEAWTKVLKVRYKPDAFVTGEQLKHEFGLPLAVIGQHIMPDLPEEKMLPILKELEDTENQKLLVDPPQPYEGLEEVLKKLQPDYPMYIVSNCQAGYIETFLGATGLTDYFQDHLCPGDTGLFKADNIREICRRHALKKALYIGDIEKDHIAASEAGVDFCHAAYGFGEVENPTFRISDIRELPAALAPACHSDSS
ncbi:MAG: HAD family hydrolase [Eubacterium sp.]|nr:HAD family hydrolase [Eubacterium sp.]